MDILLDQIILHMNRDGMTAEKKSSDYLFTLSVCSILLYHIYDNPTGKLGHIGNRAETLQFMHI